MEVPPDEGVMVELGMAIALKKPTFLFRDDFRQTNDSELYPLSLMIFTGTAGRRLGGLLLHFGGRDWFLWTRPWHHGQGL